jgi:hypothetical protein
LCNTRSVISHPLGPIPGARSVWYMQVTTVIDMLATGCISRASRMSCLRLFPQTPAILVLIFRYRVFNRHISIHYVKSACVIKVGVGSR